MSNKIVPQYDPRKKQETQMFEVNYAGQLSDLLTSIVAHVKGATVRASMGVNADGYGSLTVFNSRGRPVANIVTKWDGRG